MECSGSRSCYVGKIAKHFLKHCWRKQCQNETITEVCTGFVWFQCISFVLAKVVGQGVDVDHPSDSKQETLPSSFVFMCPLSGICLGNIFHICLKNKHGLAYMLHASVFTLDFEPRLSLRACQTCCLLPSNKLHCVDACWTTSSDSLKVFRHDDTKQESNTSRIVEFGQFGHLMRFGFPFVSMLPMMLRQHSTARGQILNLEKV